MFANVLLHPLYHLLGGAYGKSQEIKVDDYTSASQEKCSEGQSHKPTAAYKCPVLFR